MMKNKQVLTFRRTFHRMPSGLWIPAQTVGAAQNKEYPFLGVSLGYADIYGRESQWSDIIERLGLYSLAQILDVVGRISAALNHFAFESRDEGQIQIVRLIFGPKTDQFLAKLGEWSQRQNGPHVPNYILFHELQLLNALKIALFVAPPDERLYRDSLSELGEALLMVTELVNRDTASLVQNTDLETPEGQQAWHKYLLTNSLFNAGDLPLHGLSRAFELFFSDKAHLKDCGCYMDLSAAFEKLAGFSAGFLWTILFAMQGHWSHIDNDDASTARGPLEQDSYLVKNLAISPEDSARIFSFVAQSTEQCRNALERRDITPEQLRPYDLLVFEDKPLLTLNGKVYCSSVRFLIKKLVSGFHFFFLNRLPDNGSKDRYLTFMGHVFADYVDRLLERVFPPGSGRYINSKELERISRGMTEVCDGIMLYAQTAVLVECKATLLPYPVRAVGDWKQYEAKLEAIFGKASNQFAATVRAIRAGEYRQLGVDPTAIKKFLPVIVVLGDFPMNNLVYQNVYSQIVNAALAGDKRVRPIQVLDVGEIEYLETAVSKGRAIDQLLEEKLVASDAGSFRNFWIQKNEEFVRVANPYLSSVFDRLADKAQEIIRSLSREGHGC